MTADQGCAHAIAVVIPCYRVADKILGVLAGIGPEVTRVYVVDDACPEGSGTVVQARCTDPRVDVIFHARNLGVGGAVISGYRRAIAQGASIIVKLDGDGQMDPAQLPRLVSPILSGAADYSKGNRFYDLRYITRMPMVRRT